MSHKQQWQERLYMPGGRTPCRWGQWAFYLLNWLAEPLAKDDANDAYLAARRKRAEAALLELADWLDSLYDAGEDASTFGFRDRMNQSPVCDAGFRMTYSNEIFAEEESAVATD
jgi:hypothetical protein